MPPHIAEESIERVAAANDIVEVISGYFPLKRAGTSWRALCPFHREKSPSFHVSPQKQAYYCFGCGAGGGVFKFVMEYERVDFATAVRRLAQKAGVTIVEEQGGPEDDKRRTLRDRLLSLHHSAAEWFHQNLLRSPGGAAARDYLKSRDIGTEIAKNWQLGYAPDGGGLLTHLRKAGFRDDELRASGLFASGDSGPLRPRFRERLMFPICNDYGEVIAFSGRVLPPSDDPAKYVNSPETPLFTKGRTLFGLHKARRPLADAGTAIVCEGQLDLIRVFESGMQNVVAPQGTAFTPAQARLLKRYAETTVLCFDSDRAGRGAVERSLPILLAAGFAVRVAALPAGEDPDSLIRRQGAGTFRGLIDSAPDYFDFAVSEAGAELENPSTKTPLVRKLAGFAASLPDDVAREAVAARIGPRLAISPGAFLASVPRKPPAIPSDDEEQDAKTSTPAAKPDAATLLLLHAAMTSLEARQWLAEQEAARLLSAKPGARLLDACLKASFDPADAGATQAFVAAQSPEAQSLLAALLLSRPPADPLQIARESLPTLRRRELEARRDAITAKLRTPGLPPQEVERLQAEVVDITKEMRQIAGSR